MIIIFNFGNLIYTTLNHCYTIYASVAIDSWNQGHRHKQVHGRSMNVKVKNINISNGGSSIGKTLPLHSLSYVPISMTLRLNHFLVCAVIIFAATPTAHLDNCDTKLLCCLFLS